MASQVISFRLGDDALAKLEERGKKGESPSQTAQRLLNDLLGTNKEIELAAVDARIQEAITPIQRDLAELRAMLEEQQPGKSQSQTPQKQRKEAA